jgi:ABC-2 type transport system ATP-binding protein
VAIIDRGKIVALGSPATLRSRLGGDVVSVEIASANDHDGPSLDNLDKTVSQLSMVQRSVKDGTRLKIYVESNEAAVPKILEAAASAGIAVNSITYSRPGLDDVFLHYAGRAFSEGGQNGA